VGWCLKVATVVTCKHYLTEKHYGTEERRFAMKWIVVGCIAAAVAAGGGTVLIVRSRRHGQQPATANK
jgi:hypothetical protein